MRFIYISLLFLLFFEIQAQEAVVKSVEQIDQKIHISYNLAGDGNQYEVKLFVSSDEGKTWEGPLQYVSGDIGKDIVTGENKTVIWDVLSEREKFQGDWVFGFEVSNADKFKENVIETFWDTNYVKMFTENYETEQFKIIKLNRSSKKIKTKILSSSTTNKNSQIQYFNKLHTLCFVTSFKTSGLLIDKGVVVSSQLDLSKNGLLINFRSGGLAVSDVSSGNLKLSGAPFNPNKSYDLSKTYDLDVYKKWCSNTEASSFQTDLLAWDNTLLNFSKNSKSQNAENILATYRFLAIGYSPDGTVLYQIIDYPSKQPIYYCADVLLKYLHEAKKNRVIALLNLDITSTNFCKTFDKNGEELDFINAQDEIRDDDNLLLFYFE